MLYQDGLSLQLNAAIRDKTAINDQHGAGNEAGCIREQIVDGTVQLFCLAKAAERGLLHDEFTAGGEGAILVGEEAAVLLAKEKAGHDGVNADLAEVALAEIHAEPAGKILDGGLGGAVADDTSEHLRSGHGAEVDDGRGAV